MTSYVFCLFVWHEQNLLNLLTICTKKCKNYFLRELTLLIIKIRMSMCMLCLVICKAMLLKLILRARWSVCLYTPWDNVQPCLYIHLFINCKSRTISLFYSIPFRVGCKKSAINHSLAYLQERTQTCPPVHLKHVKDF